MYYITVKGVTDLVILNNINETLDVFKLRNRSFLLYEIIDIKQKIRGFKAHAILLDISLFIFEEELIEERIFDFIEEDTNILIKESNKHELNNSFKALAKKHGLSYRPMESHYFDREINLEAIGYNELQIIREIFKLPVSTLQFSEADFLLRVTVDKNGLVMDENMRVLGDLRRDKLVELIHYSPVDFKERVNACLSYYSHERGFTPHMYEPWPFLHRIDNISKKIIDYKYRVFDFVKGIEPEDYPRLPLEIVQLLNDNCYIMMKDIMAAVLEGCK